MYCWETSLEQFCSALEGYRKSSGELLTRNEWDAILPATLTIFIELSVRFCADALDEDYFGWDPKRFPSHSEHSQTRAASQLTAGKSLLLNYKEANTILGKILHGS